MNNINIVFFLRLIFIVKYDKIYSIYITYIINYYLFRCSIYAYLVISIGL